MLSRFHLIPERYGRTDRRTDRRDRFAISISRVSMLTRDKKVPYVKERYPKVVPYKANDVAFLDNFWAIVNFKVQIYTDLPHGCAIQVPSSSYVKSCNPATCRFRDIRGQVARIGVSRGQKWCTGSPFLIPHLETPKDIATKRRGSPVRMTSCKI